MQHVQSCIQIINPNWMQTGQHGLLWAPFTCSRLTLSGLLQAKLGFFKASMLLLFSQSRWVPPLSALCMLHVPNSRFLLVWLMCKKRAFFILFYWNDENTTDLLWVGLSCGPLYSYQFSPCSIQRYAHSKTHYNPTDLLPWRSAKLCVLESRMAAKRVAQGHSWWKYCPRPFEDRQSGLMWLGWATEVPQLMFQLLYVTSKAFITL